MGYLKGGAEDLISHPWFNMPGQALDWDGLINQTVAPPWRPDLASADDTSFFDEEAQAECVAAQKEEGSMKLSEADAKRWHDSFQEFCPWEPPAPAADASFTAGSASAPETARGAPSP